ncbi:MAG: hypothetical protein H6Q75_1324 [Firmicutes bacterium]|nr:hypothetical protein [Bacillota bacterium]
MVGGDNLSKGKEQDALTTKKLSPQDLEELLKSEYGDKLQPVDEVRLEKQRRQQAAIKANKSRFHKA